MSCKIFNLIVLKSQKHYEQIHTTHCLVKNRNLLKHCACTLHRNVTEEPGKHGFQNYNLMSLKAESWVSTYKFHNHKPAVTYVDRHLSLLTHTETCLKEPGALLTIITFCLWGHSCVQAWLCITSSTPHASQIVFKWRMNLLLG